MSKTNHTINHNTNAGRVFDVFNLILLGAVGVLAMLPFVFIIAGSLATEEELTRRSFFLWPETLSLESYAAIFSTPTFVRSLAVTIGVTVVGTLIQLAVTVCMAYPLAKRGLPGRNIIISLIIFTMVFSAGMIPTFLLVKDLGLLNTWWALILPAAVNPFSLIIIKNFFQELPIELEESAKIDGATELRILWSILLPLSKPVLATFALFYAVGIWNDFMSPLLYLSDSSMWTLQMFLRQVTVAANVAVDNPDPNYIAPAQGIKFAVVVVATIPILLFYPFLQKHFAKGILIGSVKG
jgi:putative aldouronate transport system permease protein